MCHNLNTATARVTPYMIAAFVWTYRMHNCSRTHAVGHTLRAITRCTAAHQATSLHSLITPTEPLVTPGSHPGGTSSPGGQLCGGVPKTIAAASPDCSATRQLLSAMIFTPTLSSASAGNLPQDSGSRRGAMPTWPGSSLRLPRRVTLPAASSSASEQEGANGWQGDGEGRLPGRTNVLNANSVGKADEPVTLNHSLGAELFCRPR